MNTASPPQSPTTPDAFTHEAPIAKSSSFSTSTRPLAPLESNITTNTIATTPPIDDNDNNNNSSNSSNSSNITPSPKPPTSQVRHPNPPKRNTTHKHPSIHHHHHHHHQRNPFTHLLRPLQPLVSLETGLPHPLFPRTRLAYHLLSHAQLDTLAAHYHQLHPSRHSLGYPTAVVGRWWAKDGGGEGGHGEEDDSEALLMMKEARKILGLGDDGVGARKVSGGGCRKRERDGLDGGEAEEECMREGKRRRFGRFIGMMGCESPGREDERVMIAAMEAWIEGEVDRRMAEESEREGWWMGKGAW